MATLPISGHELSPAVDLFSCAASPSSSPDITSWCNFGGFFIELMNCKWKRVESIVKLRKMQEKCKENMRWRRWTGTLLRQVSSRQPSLLSSPPPTFDWFIMVLTLCLQNRISVLIIFLTGICLCLIRDKSAAKLGVENYGRQEACTPSPHPAHPSSIPGLLPSIIFSSCLTPIFRYSNVKNTPKPRPEIEAISDVSLFSAVPYRIGHVACIWPHRDRANNSLACRARRQTVAFFGRRPIFVPILGCRINNPCAVIVNCFLCFKVECGMSVLCFLAWLPPHGRDVRRESERSMDLETGNS